MSAAHHPPDPLAELQAADRAAGARHCRQCGCTDRYACPGGCSWAAADLCSVCDVADDVDPGPELPTYPTLPVAGVVLDLDGLEAWLVAVERGAAELEAAADVVVVEVTPTDDVDAIVVRLHDFAVRRRYDVAWVCGWMGGRTAGLVCPSIDLPEALATLAPGAQPGYRQGWAAGLLVSAEHFEALGEPGQAAFRRSAADLVAQATP